MKYLLALCSLLVLAAGLSAAPVTKKFPLNSDREISAWGNAKRYTDYKATAANGTARLEIVQTADANRNSFQWSIPCNMEFLEGTTYTITGTVKANRDLSGNMIFQQHGNKYAIFASQQQKLKAGIPQDFKLVYTPKTDITEPTRIASFHALLQTGDVLELSRLQVTFTAPEWMFPQPRKEAKTFYLSPDGNDRADGSAKSPWKTIDKANKFLFPGDTVQFLPGTYAGTIAPALSGTAGKPIVYKGGKEVFLTGGKDGWCIRVSNRKYITVDGFSAIDVRRWMQVLDSEHCIFRNLTFSGASWGCPVYCNGIRYCLFDSILAERSLSHDSNGLVSGDMWNNARAFHNVFQNIRVSRAGHRPFGIMEGCDCNVVRDSVFDGRYGRNFEMFYPAHTLMERCTLTNCYNGSGSADPRAKWFVNDSIFRNNVITRNNGIPLVANSYYDRWHKLQLGITGSRMYHNTFFMNDAGAWDISEDGGRKDKERFYITGNVYMNNIFFDNDRAGAGTSIQMSGNMQPDGNLFRNNILAGNKPGMTTVRRAGDFMTTAEAAKQLPQMFRDNLDADPQLVNPVEGDLQLKKSSPAVDAGDFLAKVKADASGKVVNVTDAAMFYDGYGIPWEQGDLVYIGPDKLQARIVKADREKNELTLDRNVTVKTGWGVSLPYAGKAPDMGAYELGMTTGPAKLPEHHRQPGLDRVHPKPVIDCDFEPEDFENWFFWFKVGRAYYCWGGIEPDGANGSKGCLTSYGLPVPYMEVNYSGFNKKKIAEWRKQDVASDSDLRILIEPPQWELDVYPYLEFDYKLKPGTPWGVALEPFVRPGLPYRRVYLGGTADLQAGAGINLKKFTMIADGKWHHLRVDVRQVREALPGMQRAERLSFRCGNEKKLNYRGGARSSAQAWIDNVQILDK